MYSGGSGTINDPYLIANPTDLNDVRNNLSAYFKQIVDIDIDVPPYNTGDGWVPINSFSGDYNGNGKAISGIYDRRIANYQGLFGSNMSGHIHGVSMENIDFFFAPGNDVDYVGSLVARVASGGLVEKCKAESGSMFSSTTSNSDYQGALVGYVDSGGIVQDCVSKMQNTGSRNVGGIVGYNLGTVQRCFANRPSGTIVTANTYCGGVVGSGSGTTTHCVAYAGGITSGLSAVGRIARQGNLVKNYAWDSMTKGYTIVSDPDGIDGEDKTLAELKAKSTYETDLGWDFADTWIIKEDSVPELRVFTDDVNAIFFGTNF